ncbi:hypothetical protein MKY63_00840 [Paenibacillus sp. FSL R7-0189]|uniref:hypothetical protein n=1 Tax=Paenibacillus sp. FSL R7-0189 TaxID=2921673 RepID=UPI0030D83FB4
MTTQQYREVKRKAAVGERIKVVNAWATGGLYENGDVFTVTETHAEHEGAVIGVAERLSAVGIVVGEYVVLEPVTESIAPSPLSADPLYAAFRQFVADNAAEIRAILPQLEAPGISAGGIVDSPFTVADSGAVIARTPKLNRAQVIAKATADVAELKRFGLSTFANLPKESPLFGMYYAVEFHVNRDKRAVTALVKRGGALFAKFTAKCSPADVFHAEIGKAIALRKALGLTVPTEYTDAPQPDKPQVGAVVQRRQHPYDNGIRKLTRKHETSPNGFWYDNGKWDYASTFDVIDDTDVDYSAVVTEGVAA